LSIALRRKKRDAPAARAVRTPGAGSGIEALAEVVTATAAGDKAKVAHMASSRSPFSSSKANSSAASAVTGNVCPVAGRNVVM